MMIIDEKFTIGQTVYLKMDADQIPYMILGINVRPNHLQYVLNNGLEQIVAYDLEISINKDVLISVL